MASEALSKMNWNLQTKSIVKPWKIFFKWSSKFNLCYWKATWTTRSWLKNRCRWLALYILWGKTNSWAYMIKVGVDIHRPLKRPFPESSWVNVQVWGINIMSNGSKISVISK